MDIAFQWKTAESNTENCPARYKAPGGYVIQGGDWMRRPVRS
jgi:hypothetical protein